MRLGFITKITSAAFSSCIFLDFSLTSFNLFFISILVSQLDLKPFRQLFNRLNLRFNIIWCWRVLRREMFKPTFSMFFSKVSRISAFPLKIPCQSELLSQLAPAYFAPLSLTYQTYNLFGESSQCLSTMPKRRFDLLSIILSFLCRFH